MAADVKVYVKNLEQSAQEQIDIISSCEAFDGCKIRIMPDAHAGMGCVIGFTADLGEKVVPNLIGVDIGCGMLACRLKESVTDFESFDHQVKRSVPMAYNVHKDKNTNIKALGLECYSELDGLPHMDRSMGTLGSGNHFIEVDVDQNGDQWLVIHTGSRNLGKQVCDIYQKIAEETCEADVPKDLKFLTGERRELYLHDMKICQDWAVQNRDQIAYNVADHYGLTIEEKFHTVHNYIGEDNIIRKGAISAKKGETVLIPFNMKDGSVICVGKGNEDWNNSAPHGAGRKMSRGDARRNLDVQEFQNEMSQAGIYTSTANAGTIDEAPGAYKPLTDIIDLMKDTVQVVNRLIPVYNIKAESKKYGKRK